MAENSQIKNAIAKRLRAAREQAGLSQGQVARLLGFQRPTISELEAGRRRVLGEELSRFAKVYDVSVSWLTKEESEVPDPKIELAARELAKLKDVDLKTVIQLLKTLRKTESKDHQNG
jgi:transcriptional regulator with XRE-family HTH domain